MAITKLNSLAIPDNTIVEADLSYPLTNFSSTGIDDNASSTAVTIDSSQRVGVGTNAPQRILDISSANSSNIVLERTGATTSALVFNAASGETQIISRSSNSVDGSVPLVFQAGGSTRLKIDGSGIIRMGVDTGSYSNALVVDQGGNYSGYHDSAAILVRDSTGTAGEGNYHGAISFSKGTGQAAISAIQTGSDPDSVGLSFWTHASGTGTDPASERARIDGSGRVGIGTDAPSTTLNVGHENHGIGIAYVSSLPNSAGIYTSSDASHGQAYGSLVVQARAEYSGYGITFRASNQERMRILSSGGITFNGDTATANALDDYEEGTWTPSYSGSTLSGVSYINQYGFYTKTGNVVTATFRVVTTGTFTAGSSALSVAGLPFSAASSTGSEGTLSVHDATRWSSNPPIVGRVLKGTGAINIYYDFDATGAGTDPLTVLESHMRNASGNNNTLQGTIVYRT